MSDAQYHRQECPGCKLNWWLFPPVHFENKRPIPGNWVRCIQCKGEFFSPAKSAHNEAAAKYEEERTLSDE